MPENIKKEYPFCPQAHCDLEEKPALILLVVTICVGGLGLFISMFLDKKGCNLQTFLLMLLVSLICSALNYTLIAVTQIW